MFSTNSTNQNSNQEDRPSSGYFPLSQDQERVVIIGGGPAGLVTLHKFLELRARRNLLFDLQLYEGGSEIGGVWVYDGKKEFNLDPLANSSYRDLTTNTPTKLTQFCDYDQPKDLPYRLTRAQVLDYLQNYAAHFQLTPHIHCNNYVIKVEYVPWDSYLDPKDFLPNNNNNNDQHATRKNMQNNQETDDKMQSNQETDDKMQNSQETDDKMQNKQETDDKMQNNQFHNKQETRQTPKDTVNKNKETQNFPKGDSSSKKKKKWRIRVLNITDSSITTTEASFLAVCNGHYWKIHTPDVPGIDTFTGLQIHSKNYRDPNFCKGKKVLVSGLGISGSEIFQSIATLAQQVRGCSTRISISDAYYSPQVTKIDGQCVTFQDQTTWNPDIIIWCTGYEYSFPFLDPKLIQVTPKPSRIPLYKYVWPLWENPTLCFIGTPTVRGALFSAMDHQAEWVARVYGKENFLIPLDKRKKEVQIWEETVKKCGIRYRPMNIVPDEYNAMLRQLMNETEINKIN